MLLISRFTQRTNRRKNPEFHGYFLTVYRHIFVELSNDPTLR